MRVVDTSAFIEWLLKSPTGLAVIEQLPAVEDWIVPTIVQLELHKWLVREIDERRAARVIAFTDRCHIVPLDTSLALKAADLGVSAKLATADAVIYATAQHFDASLLTCDAHFSGLDGVVLVPKVRA